MTDNVIQLLPPIPGHRHFVDLDAGQWLCGCKSDLPAAVKELERRRKHVEAATAAGMSLSDYLRERGLA